MRGHMTGSPFPLPAGLENMSDPRLRNASLMKRYAAEQLRRAHEENRDYKIAFELIGDAGVAESAVRTWNLSQVVINERVRLQEEHGERTELPTKETILKEVLDLSRNKVFTVAERLKAYTLYSELSGYTGRTANASTSVSVFANKVMVVKNHGTDDEWEKAAKAQQSQLVKDARADSERNSQTHH